MLQALGGGGINDDAEAKGSSEQPKPLVGVGPVLATLTASYMVMVVVSVVFEVTHVDLDLIVCMSILVLLFSILALLTMVMMDKHLRRLDDKRDQKKTPVDVDVTAGLHGDL